MKRVDVTIHPDVWLDPEALEKAVRKAALRIGPMKWRVARKSIDARSSVSIESGGNLIGSDAEAAGWLSRPFAKRRRDKAGWRGGC